MNKQELQSVVKLHLLFDGLSLASSLREERYGDGLHLFVNVVDLPRGDPSVVASVLDRLSDAIFDELASGTLMERRSEQDLHPDILQHIGSFTVQESDMIRSLGMCHIGVSSSRMSVIGDHFIFDGNPSIISRCAGGSRLYLSPHLHVLHARLNDGAPATGYSLRTNDIVYRTDANLAVFPMTVTKIVSGVAHAVEDGFDAMLFPSTYDPDAFHPVQDVSSNSKYSLVIA